MCCLACHARVAKQLMESCRRPSPQEARKRTSRETTASCTNAVSTTLMGTGGESSGWTRRLSSKVVCLNSSALLGYVSQANQEEYFQTVSKNGPILVCQRVTENLRPASTEGPRERSKVSLDSAIPL